MKKYILFIFIFGIIFTACDPNKDIYDNIKNAEVPYFENDVTYTLIADDYANAANAAGDDATTPEEIAWAEYIDTYNSFNSVFSANSYVSDILSDRFPALNDSSNIIVTYNQYIGEMYGGITSDELTDDDYIAFGGTIADTLCFINIADLDNLPVYLSGKYPDAVADNYAEVFYRYPDQNTTAGSFFMYDGINWVNVENSIVLTTEDYDSMGEGDNQPGKYDNFSDDALPSDYLPQFLNINYPYAQEGLQKIIICEIYGYETDIYVITCNYNGTDWDIVFPGKEMSSQFIHNGEKWVFDPTVTFTMSPADYQIIVDHVAGIYPNLIDSYGDSEFYSGASSFYVNFDIRISKRIDYDPTTWENLSEENANTLIWERLRESIIVMLQNKFPNAEPDVEGVEVHYFITFDAYIGNYQHIFYTIEYKCSSAGSPPTFELVTDAIEITN